MFKNTTNSRKREALFDSEFWRMVIEQACINKALSIMMNAKGDMRHKKLVTDSIYNISSISL